MNFFHLDFISRIYFLSLNLTVSRKYASVSSNKRCILIFVLFNFDCSFLKSQPETKLWPLYSLYRTNLKVIHFLIWAFFLFYRYKYISTNTNLVYADFLWIFFYLTTLFDFCNRKLSLFLQRCFAKYYNFKHAYVTKSHFWHYFF